MILLNSKTKSGPIFEKPTGITKYFCQVVAAGSVTVAYPFDTVRRRLMMMSGEKEKMYKVTEF